MHWTSAPATSPGLTGEDPGLGALRPPHPGLVSPPGLPAPLPGLWCCTRAAAESSKAQDGTDITGGGGPRRAHPPHNPTTPPPHNPTTPQHHHPTSQAPSTPARRRPPMLTVVLLGRWEWLGPDELSVQGTGPRPLPYPPSCQGARGRGGSVLRAPPFGHTLTGLGSVLVPGSLCPLGCWHDVPPNSRQWPRHPASQPTEDTPSPLSHTLHNELQKLAFISFQGTYTPA